MIVDDEQSIVDALSDLLESEGCIVAAATDGLQALEYLLAGLRPGLILLDLMMPRMDGWNFRHAQMKFADLRDIPVIVLSAFDLGDPSVTAQFGEVELLSKPFAPETLLRLVRQTRGE